MKTEEKAKAYDSIIERANKMRHENCEACQMCIEELISELKKSEDERIRKALVKLFETENFNGYVTLDGIDINDVLAWLEKQSEVPISINVDKMVKDYANNKERDNEQFTKPLNCMIRAYRQGLTDAISLFSTEKKS